MDSFLVPQPYTRLRSTRNLSRAKKLAESGRVQAADVLLHAHFCCAKRRARFLFEEREIPRIASAIRRRFPRHVRGILREAGEIARDRFCGPGTRGRYIELGTKFPWSLEANPLPNRDQEFTARLNRMIYVISIAEAYWYAGREARYAEHAVRLIDRFIAAQPAPRPYRDGLKWKPDSWGLLQVALRTRAWVWAYHLLRRTDAFTPAFLARFLGHVAAQCDILADFPNRDETNHSTMEMMSLLEAAVTFPEFENAAHWRRVAVKRLGRCLAAQVHADGGQWEASPGYHCGCIIWFAEPYLLAKRNRIAFPAGYARTIARMAEYAAAVLRPEGTLPPVGDTSVKEVPGVLALASLLAGVRPAGGRVAPTPDLFWLFGPDAAKRLARLPESDGGAPPSRAFPETGVYVMRSGGKKSAVWALVQCRESDWGGHAHADSLSFEFAAHGRPVLADSGFFTYAEVPDRRRGKETAAHNTVTIDGGTQVRAVTSWRSEGRTGSRKLAWRSNGAYDFFCGEERSWSRLAGRPRHRRALVLRKGPGPYLLVVDWILGKGRHRAEARFHFDTVRVRRAEHGARSIDAKAPNVLVESLDGARARLAPDRLSRGYDESHPSRTLALARSRSLPFVIASLVVPAKDSKPPRLSARLVTASRSRVVVEIEDGRRCERLVVTARGVKLARG